MYDDCVFFTRENNGFYNLYFYTNEVSKLNVALDKFHKDRKYKLVLDLVGRISDIREIAEVFRKNKYQVYANFNRMYKIAGDICIANINIDDKGVEFANLEDVNEIYAILTKEFDEFSEHLPALNEIYQAINLQSIIVVKKESEILAILFFDKVGYTSTLRYWYVNQRYRGVGVGAKLMNRYFYECRDIKRFILWVNAKNELAIPIYKYFGYREDNIVDIILIKGEK